MARSACLLACACLLAGCTWLTGAASLSAYNDDTNELIQRVDASPTTEAAAPHHSSSTSAADGAAPSEEDPDAAAVLDPGAHVDASSDMDATGPTQPTTLSFAKSLLEGQQQVVGPFRASGGTLVDVRTTGTGDPDLFIRFNQRPTVTLNDCASDYDGANERCRRVVPGAEADLYVLVDAWADCNYTLTVSYTPLP